MKKRVLSSILAIAMTLVSVVCSPVITTSAGNAREIEGNGMLSSATALKSGTKTVGACETNADVDYYKFNYAKNGYVKFTFAIEEMNAMMNNGWKITFLNGNGDEIYHVDEQREAFTSIRFNFKKGKKMFVKVECAWGGVTAEGIKYSLKPTFKADATSEQEPNDNAKKATVLTAGKAKSATIYKQNDDDFFLYKAPKKKTVKVQFAIKEEPQVTGGWQIDIYETKIDQNHQLVYEHLDTDKTVSLKAKKGKKYYIKISAPSGYQESPIDVMYSIKVKK